jgi:hypothetical protein
MAESTKQEEAGNNRSLGHVYQPQQPDEHEVGLEEGVEARMTHQGAHPTSPCLTTSKYRRRRLIEFTYFPRKVRFEGHQSGDEGDDKNPLKISAIVFGFPILTEREADYRLSQKVEEWKKLLFLFSNVPYLVLALGSLFLTHVEHRSFHPYFDQLCESTFAHCALACLVSVTSICLHSSQVRVGHWCCSPAKARTFHRRRVQDKFDLADCFCASLAVILAVFCHGVVEMGTQMMAVVPIFVLSIVVKKLQWWNTYLIVHGIWHVATAYLLLEILIPAHSPLREFVRNFV